MVECLSSALVGSGRFLLLSGEAGVGKTRLVEEFTLIARSRGCSVALGRCLPGASFPYLPFLEAFDIISLGSGASSPPTIGDDGRLPYSRSLPSWLSTDPRRDSDRALLGFLGRVREACRAQPLVVILEDIHWADSATLHLLHFMARNAIGLSVLIIGTYRTEEAGERRPDGTTLLDTLRLMRREGVCSEIEVEVMGRADIGAITVGVLGNKADDALVDRLMAETQGNPLFAVEMLRMLLSSGRICLESGRWRLAGFVGPEVPATVKEVVLRRVEGLPPDMRRLLEFAAVEGLSFDPRILGPAAGLDRLFLLGLLDDLCRSQFIAPIPGGYEFGHELVRRVLYANVSQARRTEMHRHIAEAMEAMAVPALYGDLALHCCRSDLKSKCLQFSLLAGEECLSKCAWIEALPHLERAAALGEEVDAEIDIRFRVVEGLGEANKELGNATKALECYRTLLRLGPLGNRRARVLRRTADMWTYGSGSVEKSKDEVLRTLDEAENTAGLEDREKMEIAFSRALILQSVNDVEEAKHQYAVAIDIARRVGAKDRLGILLSSYAFVFISRGEIAEALKRLEEARLAYESDPYPSAEVEMLTCLGEANLYAGKTEEAMGFFEQCIRSSDALGFYHNSRWSHFYRALVFSELGDLEAAKEEAHGCQRLDAMTDTPFTKLVPNTILVHLKVMEGEYQAAESLCLENQEMLDKFTTELGTPVVGLALAVHAELLAARGSWGASDAQFQSALRHLNDVWGGIYFGALVREWYSASLACAGDLEGAREIAREAMVSHAKLGNVARAARIGHIMDLEAS